MGTVTMVLAIIAVVSGAFVALLAYWALLDILAVLRRIATALESSLDPAAEDGRQQAQEKLAAARYRSLMEDPADEAERTVARAGQDAQAYARRRAIHHQECVFGGRPHAGGCVTGHAGELETEGTP